MKQEVTVDPSRVNKTLVVAAPQDIAWRVFTEQIGTWWPLAHYKIGSAKAVDAVVEPRVGAAGTSAAKTAATAAGARSSSGNPRGAWS